MQSPQKGVNIESCQKDEQKGEVGKVSGYRAHNKSLS